MSRFAFMARRPKRTLAVLALLLVAIAVTVGSGAQFTAQTANPTNTFTAGTLQMTNSANGTAIFTSPPLWKPADSRTGLVDIQNTGTLNGNFVLSTSNITGSVPLSNVLRVQIDDCGDWTGPGGTTPPTCTLPSMQTIYPSGTISGLSGLSTPGTGPGQTYVPNEKRRYFITVTWPNGTPAVDNPLQGTSTAFDFVWSAT